MQSAPRHPELKLASSTLIMTATLTPRVRGQLVPGYRRLPTCPRMLRQQRLKLSSPRPALQWAPQLVMTVLSVRPPPLGLIPPLLRLRRRLWVSRPTLPSVLLPLVSLVGGENM